jgi:23S rRNA (uracil1939-C5)-methyltransferase
VQKRNKYPFLQDLEVTGIGSEGKAIARHEERVVFIPMVIPGDIVDVQVIRKRKSYWEAKLVELKKPSLLRQDPVCRHFGICGGCKWQMLPYEEQLKAKQKQVVDQLTRIGKLALPPVREILSSEKTELYRNKLEFTFSNKRWLTKDEISEDKEFGHRNAVGFHVPGLFDKVVDIEKCWLQEDPSNDIRNAVREYALANSLDFFDLREQKGFLRNLIIRISTIGEVMVILSFYYDDKKMIEGLMEHLKEGFPGISSLQYVVNRKANDTILDQDIIVYHGKDHIIEQMGELRFKVGPKSFYQTNSPQAYRLYQVVLEFADLKGGETVYDLYTGTGTIANFMAGSASKVVGVELIPEAIDDARENSRINGIENTDFVVADMKDALTNEFFEEHGKPDLIVLDPPRAGIHENVVKGILEAEPGRIVYVSCNPGTQARDIALMAEKYEVTALQPVDMFPHTHHVENIVQLRLKT